MIPKELTSHLSNFVDNRYKIVYLTIIDAAIKANRSKSNGYYEQHHIIPRSMAPEIADFKSFPFNGVLLTAREHILCHRLLCKITTGDWRKSALRAFHAMCFKTNGGKNLRFPTSHQYHTARIYLSIANKGIIRSPQVPKWFVAETLDEFKLGLQALVASGMSDPAIGRQYGVTAQNIYAWRQKLNIALRRSGLRSKEWLEAEYLVQRKSSQEIADQLGCTDTAVRQYLHKFGIPIRSSLECQHNRPFMGQLPRT